MRLPWSTELVSGQLGLNSKTNNKRPRKHGNNCSYVVQVILNTFVDITFVWRHASDDYWYAIIFLIKKNWSGQNFLSRISRDIKPWSIAIWDHPKLYKTSELLFSLGITKVVKSKYSHDHINQTRSLQHLCLSVSNSSTELQICSKEFQKR